MDGKIGWFIAILGLIIRLGLIKLLCGGGSENGLLDDITAYDECIFLSKRGLALLDDRCSGWIILQYIFELPGNMISILDWTHKLTWLCDANALAICMIQACIAAFLYMLSVRLGDTCNETWLCYWMNPIIIFSTHFSPSHSAEHLLLVGLLMLAISSPLFIFGPVLAVFVSLHPPFLLIVPAIIEFNRVAYSRESTTSTVQSAGVITASRTHNDNNDTVHALRSKTYKKTDDCVGSSGHRAPVQNSTHFKPGCRPRLLFYTVFVGVASIIGSKLCVQISGFIAQLKLASIQTDNATTMGSSCCLICGLFQCAVNYASCAMNSARYLMLELDKLTIFTADITTALPTLLQWFASLYNKVSAAAFASVTLISGSYKYAESDGFEAWRASYSHYIPTWGVRWYLEAQMLPEYVHYFQALPLAMAVLCAWIIWRDLAPIDSRLAVRASFLNALTIIAIPVLYIRMH